MRSSHSCTRVALSTFVVLRCLLRALTPREFASKAVNRTSNGASVQGVMNGILKIRPVGGRVRWPRPFCLVGLLALALACAAPVARHTAPSSPPSHFPVAARTPISAGRPEAPRPTPFVSFNLPNLHYIEDDWRFASTLRYRLPNEYEIHDGLETVRLMGGSVIRIYTLSVRKPTDTPEVVRHVLAPGRFDEAAFRTLDLVLAMAAELGIRVIIPFVDNWSHWGGVAEYAAFRAKPRDAFFTDPELIADFEKTIEKVVLRTNSINGRKYASDPTIYAWETGNELGSPDRWVSQIARFIKSLDRHHAVVDGTYGPRIREHSVMDPNIDIVSSHHYGPVSRTLRLIDENLAVVGNRKRYFIGEFGLLSAKDTQAVLEYALKRNVEGILLWSLRFHDRDGGFYSHMEKPPYQSYHFPGFVSGHDYEEQPIVQLMRRLAFEVRGDEVPASPAPATPSLLPITEIADIRWRGSAGASYYMVEREIAGTGKWQVVANRVDESLFPYRPAFVDDSAPIGSKVRYRVVAANETGISPPSLPSEEVLVSNRVLVDEMHDSQLMAGKAGPLTFTTNHAELCKMDRERLIGKAGAQIAYHLKGHPRSLRIYSFAERGGGVFDLSWSSNGHAFAKLDTEERVFAGAVDEPSTFVPVLVSATRVPTPARDISITWRVPAEIGRVEIDWVP